MSWDDILADPEFQAQPTKIKAEVATNYFKQNIADKDFLRQPPEIQAQVKTNFYGTLQEKPDIWNGQIKPTLLETGKQIFEIPKTIGDVALGFGGGALGWGLGSIAGIAEGTQPGATRESVQQARENIEKRLSFEPQTQPGQILMEKAGRLMNAVTQPAAEASSLVGESWDSPLLESILKFAGEAATFEALGKATNIRPNIKAPEWYRRMTIPERGLVEGIKADLSSGQFTPDQIRQLWKDPANRAELLKRYQGVGEPAPEQAGTFAPETPPREARLSNPIIADALLKAAREKALPGPEGMDMNIGQDFTVTPSRALADMIIRSGRGRLPAGQTPMLPEPPASSPVAPEIALLAALTRKHHALPAGQGFELVSPEEQLRAAVERAGQPKPESDAFDMTRPSAKVVSPEKPVMTGNSEIASEMVSTVKEGMSDLRRQVSNVRYGDPGEILFEFKGKTYKAPEPTDVMPVGQGEASQSWALKQVLDKKATPTKTKPKAAKVKAEPASPAAKEPWEMTREEFEASPPKGFQVKRLDGEDIARAETDGTISVDPDNFFGHSAKDRAEIISHERAHFGEGQIKPEYKAKLFDNETIMSYRGRNINEKLANMIQDGKLPPEVLKDYPELAKPAESATIPAVTKKPGTANIPAKEKPLAEAVDEITGLPLNPDGTVTLYHGTTKANADTIKKTGVLKSNAEPDVYLTTAKEGTGYGDTSIAVNVDPKKLLLDDEFPDGRKDFRISTGKAGGSVKVSIPEITPKAVGGISRVSLRKEGDLYYVYDGDTKNPMSPFDEKTKPIGENLVKSTNQNREALETEKLRQLSPKKIIKSGVFHGTSGKFDVFDTAKIGSGEGAQAYGYGIYLTESPSIADQYAYLKYRRGQKELPRYRYRVDLVSHDDLLFLDWGKPLPEKIKALIRKGRTQWENTEKSAEWGDLQDNMHDPLYTGEDLYRDLEKMFRETDHPAKSASAVLNGLGIDGIQYRGSIDTANNYVVFNEYPLKITEIKNLNKQSTDLPNPSRPPEGGGANVLSSERGSTGDLSQSEIVAALRKTKDSIDTAIPHLERLGRSIYESGKTDLRTWATAMKKTLGDLWDSFKDVMVRVWRTVSKPVANQRGAVGVDINAADKGSDIYARNRAMQSKGVAKTAREELREVADDIKLLTDEYFGAISTRLENIHPQLRVQMRKMEMNAGVEASRAIRRVEPMLQKIKGMTKEDRIDFDLARKNGDAPKLKELIDKYKMWPEYTNGTRAVLNELHEKAKAVGFDVGYLKHFHPRVIKDPKGFLAYFRNQADWPVLEMAIRAKETELGRYLEIDEKASLINKLLRGYRSGQISLSKPGQLKSREIGTVTPELNRYYMDSDAALLRYISTVTDAIEMRRAFGVTKKGAASPQDTIGHYILGLLERGIIRPEDEPVLRSIYNARFNEQGTRGVIGLYKNLSYIDTMGSPISAITQIGDLAWALYKNGIVPTARAVGKATVGKSAITKEDIGIDMIAKEFADTSKASRAVRHIFDWIGLSKIDNIGKESLINSTINEARKKARDPRKVDGLRKELKPIFEGETDGLIKDLADGKITENVKLYAFNTLSDFQPISLSEMPQKYLTGGNGRIFYMLKSFTLKQFDVYRREVFRNIGREGTRLKGLKNLLFLSAAFIAANASADVIKALILNRDIDPGDLIVDNLARLAGISKYTVWKARTEGTGSALVRTIAPPFKLADSLTKDIATAGNGKGLETPQSIPMVGKLYYWWFGKGADKEQRRAERQRNNPAWSLLGPTPEQDLSDKVRSSRSRTRTRRRARSD